MKLFEALQNFVSVIDVNSISDERKDILQPLIEFIQGKVDTKEDIRLNFICTHNSRRSHL